LQKKQGGGTYEWIRLGRCQVVVSGMFDRTDRQQGGRCEDDEKVILEIFQGREKRSRSMLLSNY
jgi:hypothetical protein